MDRKVLPLRAIANLGNMVRDMLGQLHTTFDRIGEGSRRPPQEVQLYQICHHMEITRVSNEGSVIIPEPLLRATGWEIGQELIAIDMGEGILLKPKKPFSETTLDDVAGCLKYQGTPKTLEDMDDAINQGVEESWYGRS